MRWEQMLGGESKTAAEEANDRAAGKGCPVTPQQRVFYLSGPMTGKKDHNKPLFDEAAGVLRERYPDAKVISPVELDADEDLDITGDGWAVGDEQYEELLARDVAAVDRCTDIVFLKGWSFSGGAGREGRRAIERGIRMYVLDRDNSHWFPLLRIHPQFFLAQSTTERKRPNGQSN